MREGVPCNVQLGGLGIIHLYEDGKGGQGAKLDVFLRKHRGIVCQRPFGRNLLEVFEDQQGVLCDPTGAGKGDGNMRLRSQGPLDQ